MKNGSLCTSGKALKQKEYCQGFVSSPGECKNASYSEYGVSLVISKLYFMVTESLKTHFEKNSHVTLISIILMVKIHCEN